MCYSINSEVFEKITLRGIKGNQETMEFLTKQAEEIFTDERQKWEDDQESDEDRLDPELWCEYCNDAEKKLEKYLYRWFDDIRWSISLHAYEEKFPCEIVSIFKNYIEEICERISFEEFAGELIGDIFEQYTQKREKKA